MGMYDELFAQVPAKSGAAAMEELTEDERAGLETFEVWLIQEGKAESTAKAYKGYVAKAIVAIRGGANWDSLTTDVRSAVHQFQKHTDELAAADADDDSDSAA
jgi:rubrerythrin